MTKHDFLYNFHNGACCDAYKFFGCHKYKDGFYFAVWAPDAKSVSVVGSFNGWKDDVNVMQLLNDGETFYCYVENAVEGDEYKYLIVTKNSERIYKCDPYAYLSNFPKSTASIVYCLEKPYDRLSCVNSYREPMNIYEVNLLSWQRNKNGKPFSFKQLSKTLVPYVKKMGYTHVEFMPITEYPFDDSWGYQVTGYFSPVARLGSPSDFAYLINEFHKNGIKVILDWVPAHFPKDSFGLIEFSGQPLYESSDEYKKEYPIWGTRRFDYGKNEVINFLISSACFWLKQYAIDGLRVDAVASIIYLDFDKKEGEWLPNALGDNRDFDGINFLKKLNACIHKVVPDAITVAEESSAFDGVTRAVDDGGLGFDYKWNMGWMNDVLFYCKQDPIFRSYHHEKLTFSMMYSFSENYVLPLSHDEVVHVKGSIVNKMFGEGKDKFSGERLLLSFMFAHPGKKLNFMGYELAQFSEWDFSKQVEFELLKIEEHAQMKRFVKTLNKFYSNCPAFYQIERDWAGFKWLSVDDSINNVIAFERVALDGSSIVAIFNFSGIDLLYELAVDGEKYKRIFNTDFKLFGGTGKRLPKIIKSRMRVGDGTRYLKIKVPRLTCLYLEKF